jgi:cytidylate kinase
MRSYWTGGVDTWAVIPSSHVLNERSLAATTGVLIREAAQLGDCIILGRASQCLLRDRSDTFHVFVYAPVEERVWRLLGRYPNELDAELAMTEIDRARATYLRKYYDRDWNDPYLYDLILNSMTGDAGVVATILAACKLNPAHA